ncbi:hypothetical protein AB6A40_010635 [Gnathostoma spinigerum]|uniref:Uncharacterized protein n=1 Tax=Gnathostoma spinigerum TaxID=75299 RepID=A0ABD6EX51_9BILA
MIVFQVLESGIWHLDALENFDPILFNLGRRHGKLESSVGFHSSYWSVFLECTIHHIRKCLEYTRLEQWSLSDLDDVITLWRHLVGGICQRIEEGYLIDLANRSYTRDENKPVKKLHTEGPISDTRETPKV